MRVPFAARRHNEGGSLLSERSGERISLPFSVLIGGTADFCINQKGFYLKSGKSPKKILSRYVRHTRTTSNANNGYILLRISLFSFTYYH